MKVFVKARRLRWIPVPLRMLCAAVAGALLSVLPCPAQAGFQLDPPEAPEVLAAAENQRPLLWKSAADFMEWQPQDCELRAAEGGLEGNATGPAPALTVENVSRGVDLGLGWHQFIDLKLRLPAAPTGPLRLSFGVEAEERSDPSRTVEIPRAGLPRDGGFHVYRIGMNRIPRWRGKPGDLRLEIPAAGGSFALAWLRIGDEPGAAPHLPVLTPECPAAGAATPDNAVAGKGKPVLAAESKHFRLLWNEDAAVDPAGCLRNLEEAWRVLADTLGFRPPCFTLEDRDGKHGAPRGKTNVTTWYGGYFAGLTHNRDGGRGWLNIDPSGMRVDPPTWVIPHELAHVFQFYNDGGGMPGEWYEGHANYARERWLAAYQFLFPGVTAMDPLGARFAHIIIGDGRDEYLKWTPFLYLDSNPDQLPDRKSVV